MSRRVEVTPSDPVEALWTESRAFGPRSARTKHRLLDALERSRPPSVGRVAWLDRLDDLLGFMRAYPDTPQVLSQVRRLIGTLPDSSPVVYPYSYDVARRLLERLPGQLEIQWDDLEDQGALIDTLSLLVTPGEELGLEDTGLSLTDWFARCRSPGLGDLGFLLSLLERSPFSSRVRGHLYEQCNLPIRFEGSRRSQIAHPVRRVAYQRRDISRERAPIGPVILRAMRPARRGDPELVDVALRALAVRSLEIYPLTHANSDDVAVTECGRGLRIVLIGVLPEHRSPLESLHVFLIMKNDVPIAYGPAGVFLGCCEMGINLFPEFRGGEIWQVYSQCMRTLHHLLGVDYFYVTRYGMGEHNPAAIATGAFWFYRKLGFRPTNEAVERLAQAEEARMRARKGYRSDRRMLRRLSHTEAVLDLSVGRCRPFDFGRVGVASSRRIAVDFDGDRARAQRAAADRMAHILDMPSDPPAVRALAPLLDLIPDLETWSRGDVQALARILRAKGGRSERRAALGFKAHRRLERALRSIS